MVRRIKHLFQQSAAAKILVFSSWQDVLELVSHALQTNKLPYAYARGRKAFDSAVADFKQPLPAEGGMTNNIQILLLLVKQGANGLNLTGGLISPFTHLCRVCDTDSVPLHGHYDVNPACSCSSHVCFWRCGALPVELLDIFVLPCTVAEHACALSKVHAPV